MTITLAPDPNPRRIDRAAQPKRHTGPYYGSQLRRVLDPPPEQSIAERITTYYAAHRWPAAALLVIGCALIGLSIVAATWQIR